MHHRTLARSTLTLLVLLGAPVAFAQDGMLALAQTLVALAVIAAFVIALWRGAPRSMRWLGRLPGDLRIERERYTIYMPLVSALLVGVAVSVAVSAVSWLLALVPALFTWIGRLPGDVVVRRGVLTVFVPITSLIVLSLVLSAIAGGVSWLLKRRRRTPG